MESHPIVGGFFIVPGRWMRTYAMGSLSVMGKG